MAQTYKTEAEKEKAFLVMVSTSKKDDVAESMSELRALSEAANADVVGEMVQNMSTPDVRYLIGSGKVNELKDLVLQNNATLVIFENQLTCRKLNALEDVLGVRVIDRTALILDIFAKRALTNEGKLQVELAQLKYNLPRLNALSGSSGRYGSGGIGMRGPGETKIEINRRVVENKILEKERELKKLKQERDIRRKKRQDSSKPIVALVGYTNSGKSTLLNTMTKANVLVKDMLFATLDTTTRSLWLGQNKEIMVIDTVGFVSKLPHELIDAFASTLEEAKYADLLINVVDISNSHHVSQEEVISEVLHAIGAENIPMITAYNKCDKVNLTDRDDKIYISAKLNIGIDILKAKIEEILFPI